MGETAKAPSHPGMRLALAGIVLASVVLLIVCAALARRGVVTPVSELIVMEPMRAGEPAGPLAASALTGGDKLAGRLALPKLPSEIRGIVNPDEEKKDKSFRYDPSLIPPPYDKTGMQIKPMRLQKIVEAGDSGWGYTNPAGFTEDPESEGLWKSENAVILVTSPRTSKECTPACAGKTLDVGQLKRSTASGYRTYTFQCEESVSVGGATWPLHETTILDIRSDLCVKSTLAARSDTARKQAQEEFFNLYRRLTPLPPLPEKPLFDGKGRSQQVSSLR